MPGTLSTPKTAPERQICAPSPPPDRFPARQSVPSHLPMQKSWSSVRMNRLPYAGTTEDRMFVL